MALDEELAVPRFALSGASAGEVRSTLERVRKFDAMWTCEKCNTRIWKESGVRCKCGASPFPPNVAAK